VGSKFAYRLKVNFWNSCLTCINVGADFIENGLYLSKLQRKRDPIQVSWSPGGSKSKTNIYLGIYVRYNFQKRLNSWGNKYISLGGRITLLNAVLNSILIFYMSFLKCRFKC
jgi:hypothetical protein